MKQSSKIVNKNVEKRGKGRPRTVSDNDQAPAVAVRLPRETLAVVGEYATEQGVTRSVAIRDMVDSGIKEWLKIRTRAAPRRHK